MENTITRTAFMNNVVLTGNIGAAESIYKNDKGNMAAFPLAHYAGKDANGKERSMWIDVKVFNTEKTPNDLSIIEKGQKVVVKGHLDYEEFTTKAGQPARKLILVADKVELNVPVKYVAVGSEEDLPVEF